MSHPTQPVPPLLSIKEAIATGKISKNAQVSGYKGHPNPTLGALISSGVIKLDALVSSVSLSGGYGGE
jgi:hypothetical protein